MTRHVLWAALALLCALHLPALFPASPPSRCSMAPDGLRACLADYQTLLKGVSRHLSGYDDTSRVLVWQDHDANLHFSDAMHTSIFPVFVHELTNHHAGRLAILPQEALQSLALVWLAVFLALVALHRAAAQHAVARESHSGEHEHDRTAQQARPVDASVQDAYRTLGLDPGATAGEIRRAYRRKISACHPDRYANLSPEFQVLATHKTQELNRAYEQLLAC